ncbi:MAG TPA: 50S ribosomal protein L32 [Tissierellaceae bacterium]|nr:50S ribosomal protein L32 [Tissierellaceae bacterium]
MAVPKRRTSKAKKNSRRASAYKLNKATVSECPQCHEPKLPHRVCRSCGYYKNREVVNVE